MSFRSLVLAIVSVACFLCTVIAVVVSGRNLYGHGKEESIERSVAILSNLERVRSYVATQGGLDEAIADAVAKHPDGNLSKEDKANILKKVPIFASMKIGEPDKNSHYEFRIFAAEPRNKDHKPTNDEMQVLQKFEQDANLKELIEEKEGKVFVYRPVRLAENQGCLKCHGDPQTSPYKNGKDVLGYPMENWKDGRLHGVFAVVTSLAPVKAAATQSTMMVFLFSAVGTLVFIGLAAFILKKPMTRLNAMTEALFQSGVSLSQAASEISTASHSLSSAASEAAASLEETSASTEEISGMIRMNSGNAQQASNLSVTCQEKAEKGRLQFQELVESMNGISESSRKIEEIISVIDDIAFQTNLLALNAAVEAARAGEQGKGFSVVAEAVRALAQRSADSAKEISTLIQSSVEQTQNGNAVVKLSQESLNEILTDIEKMAQLNSEICSASLEQAKGMENVNQAINQLDKVTQQNAAASEQSSASAEQLTRQSKELHSLVGELSGILKGSSKSA